MKTGVGYRWGIAVIAILSWASFVTPRAFGQWVVPAYARNFSTSYYQGPPPPPPYYNANRVPYPISANPSFYYYYDPVNRAYPLTPEPVWRAMFPGIHARMQAEIREFGVPGITADELAYWRRMVWQARIGQE
ncbi:MAG TPA: hypothetical protein VHY22_15620 [Chthoniobacteraceae bacterium]|jgi:hypothetical protein|nr:hypothetical protein [Chthoniobacteraceae bacterium]